MPRGLPRLQGVSASQHLTPRDVVICQGRVLAENSPPVTSIDAHLHAVELNLQVRSRMGRVLSFQALQHSALLLVAGATIRPPAGCVSVHQELRAVCSLPALPSGHENASRQVEVRHRLCPARPSQQASQQVRQCSNARRNRATAQFHGVLRGTRPTSAAMRARREFRDLYVHMHKLHLAAKSHNEKGRLLLPPLALPAMPVEMTKAAKRNRETVLLRATKTLDRTRTWPWRGCRAIGVVY